MEPPRGADLGGRADVPARLAARRMTPADRPKGLRVGGEIFRLPIEARALSEPPLCRPLPGAPGRLRGLAMVGRRCAPVWTMVPAPQAWLVIDLPEGPVVFGGEAFAEPRLDAPLLAAPPVIAVALTAAAFHVPSPASTADAAPGHDLRQRSVARPGTYVLRHGSRAAVVPVAALDAILDMPQAPTVRQLGALAGALGHSELGGRAVLLLDPAWCTGQPVAAGATGMVALFHHEGRSLAMPMEQASPGVEGEDLLARLSGTPEGRALLAGAPTASATPPVVRAEPTRPLLLCEAGGTRFAIDVAEVTNVIAPAAPMPPPHDRRGMRGVVTHRGEILPVIDLDPRLARAIPDRALATAPLLRLLLPWPVAVPVEKVLGLHAVALRAIASIEDDPLVSGMALLEGHAVPVCRGAALAAASPAGPR